MKVLYNCFILIITNKIISYFYKNLDNFLKIDKYNFLYN